MKKWHIKERKNERIENRDEIWKSWNKGMRNRKNERLWMVWKYKIQKKKWILIDETRKVKVKIIEICDTPQKKNNPDGWKKRKKN